jgi:hypothetical protein
MINGLVKFGEILQAGGDELENIFIKTELHNPWFIRRHINLSLSVFCDHFFNADKLETWLQKYHFSDNTGKRIGLVFAGNVPFVGMHDLLCVMLSGNIAYIKLSSKDDFFFPYMMQQLEKIDIIFSGKVQFVDKLEHFDAVIATGSTNSARYFTYYFGKYPHIIRRHRTSVAVLNGNETDEQLRALGKDVFYYYGLGCRNVSKIFIPTSFNPEQLFPLWENYRYVLENNKYKNNYDYNRALLLLNQVPHLSNDFFMLVENESLFSPLATLYYEKYHSTEQLTEKINALQDDLQCIVALANGNTELGKTQYPELWHYADHIDTMHWLLDLQT